MKGSIRERSAGRWAIIIDDPNSSTRNAAGIASKVLNGRPRSNARG